MTCTLAVQGGFRVSGWHTRMAHEDGTRRSDSKALAGSLRPSCRFRQLDSHRLSEERSETRGGVRDATRTAAFKRPRLSVVAFARDFWRLDASPRWGTRRLIALAYCDVVTEARVDAIGAALEGVW